MTLTLTLATESWPIAGSFAISRGAKTEALVVVAELGGNMTRGRGECVPYARYGESVDSVTAALEAMRPQLAAGLDRAGLQNAMPPGAARNALDCAFWDLEAKRSGRPVHELAGLPAPHPLTTAFTISLAAPAAMAEAAAKAAGRALLKVKLGGDGDHGGDPARIAAVRAAAPNATLIVDANEGWSEANLAANLAACAERRMWRWSSSRCRKAPTTRSRRSSTRSRSAPTRACTTLPPCRRLSANTTRSTSSSTRPAA